MAIERAASVAIGHFDDGVVARAWMMRLGEKTPSNKGDNKLPVVQGIAAIFMLGEILKGEPNGRVDAWNRWVPDTDVERLKLTGCSIDFSVPGTTRGVVSFVTVLGKMVGKQQYDAVVGRMLDRFTMGKLI